MKKIEIEVSDALAARLDALVATLHERRVRNRLRPSASEIRGAAQIIVVRRAVEERMAEGVVDGDLSRVPEPRYYYLGPTGREHEEPVGEECFLGRDDDYPRLPGYYAVDLVYLSGEPALDRPLYAIFRDQSYGSSSMSTDRDVKEPDLYYPELNLRAEILATALAVESDMMLRAELNTVFPEHGEHGR